MKKLLLIVGLSAYFVLSGIFYRGTRADPINESFSQQRYYKHVSVKLSNNIDTYMTTATNGCHVDILAKKLEIKPIVPNRVYRNNAIVFPENSPGLKELAEKLDKNNDKKITLDELFEIY